MRKVFFIVLFCAYTQTYGQTKFPQGSYMSISEIVKKSPSNKSILNVEKRSRGEIQMNGGNDFKLTSSDKSVSNKEIKKEILAYSNGDSLFINGLKYKVQKWYAPVLNNGRYLVFVGGISQDENLYNYQIQKTKTSTFWSSFGGIGGGIQGAKLALMRFAYVLDTKENELHTMDDNSIRTLLAKADLKLLSQYDTEKADLNLDMDNQEELLRLKYIDILNETSN